MSPRHDMSSGSRFILRAFMPTLRAGLLACGITGLTSCWLGGGDKVAGSEIGNPSVSVTGIAFYPDGKPAGGAKVLMRRADYLAQDAGTQLLSTSTRIHLEKASAAKKKTAVISDVFTDNQGRFTIDSVDSGSYRIEVNDGQHMGLLMDCQVGSKKNVALASDTLRATAPIRGALSWSDSTPSAYIALLYGMERAALVDAATGKFTLQDCPPGLYTVKVGCLGLGCLSKEVPKLTVLPGVPLDLDTITLPSFTGEDYTKWPGSRKLVINTAADGSNVQDTLLGFPLLVRLDSSNFDFSASDGRGRDIRFSRGVDNHLPFEIERWDSGERKAEIWVRVDTLYGNSSDTLTLWWGNASAAAYSAGSKVFPPEDGFRAVWHMAEEGSTTPNGFRDATLYGNHGTGQGMTPVSQQNAIAGFGQGFDGFTSILVPHDTSLHTQSNLTLELWVNFGALGPFKRVVSKAFASPVYPWTEYDIESDGSSKKFAFSLGIGGNNVSVVSKTPITKDQWYQVTGTYDGSMMRIYVDGALEDSTAIVGSIADYGRPVVFGKYEFDALSNFTGKIDEVRISGRARTPAWIKLTYENQRADSHLIAFLPVK